SRVSALPMWSSLEAAHDVGSAAWHREPRQLVAPARNKQIPVPLLQGRNRDIIWRNSKIACDTLGTGSSPRQRLPCASFRVPVSPLTSAEGITFHGAVEANKSAPSEAQRSAYDCQTRVALAGWSHLSHFVPHLLPFLCSARDSGRERA